MVAAFVASAAVALVFARRAQRLRALAPTVSVSLEHDYCFFLWRALGYAAHSWTS